MLSASFLAENLVVSSIMLERERERERERENNIKKHNKQDYYFR